MVQDLKLIINADLALDSLNDLALLALRVRFEVRFKHFRDAALESVTRPCLLDKILILLMLLLLLVSGFFCACFATAHGVSLLDFFDCPCLDIYLTILTDLDVCSFIVVQAIKIVLIKFLLDVIFEFDSRLQNFD